MAERFKALLKAVYVINTMKARTITNGSVSLYEININSDTRQGCLLSPLIFVIVAKLLYQSLLKDKQFKGAPCGDIDTKMLAYINILQEQ